jgi:glycosyltransferase involved in cell wall biosynthesis
MEPKVSIVIPVYNQAKYLSDAIHSALDQTYCSFEIIAVDDGSTDNSCEVVAAFGEQVRYIHQENQGLAAARNTGIRAAKGEFIGLLDADDEWLPGYLEHMVALTDRHTYAAVFYCQAQCINKIGDNLPQMLGGPPIPSSELYWKLLRANFIIPSTTLIRYESLIDAGYFDSTLRSCEDWDLWLRLLPENEIVGTNACLVRYRIHDSSLSTDPVGMQLATKAVIEKHFGPDSGRSDIWSVEKRRAYGGVYRYYLITSVQRQNDWDTGAMYLRKGLIIDSTLAEDLDLFYDLALGSQPIGLRGTPYQLAIEENALNVRKLLSNVFKLPMHSDLEVLHHTTMGTAYFALALVAYNTGKRSLSRAYLIEALKYRPNLWQDSRVAGNLLKSFISDSMTNKLKRIGKTS